MPDILKNEKGYPNLLGKPFLGLFRLGDPNLGDAYSAALFRVRVARAECRFAPVAACVVSNIRTPRAPEWDVPTRL